MSNGEGERGKQRGKGKQRRKGRVNVEGERRKQRGKGMSNGEGERGKVGRKKILFDHQDPRYQERKEKEEGDDCYRNYSEEKGWKSQERKICPKRTFFQAFP